MIDDEKTCLRIKELALKSGYQQMKQLADALYLTPQAVYKWYRLNKLPSVENLVNMADLFGCKVDDFIVRKEKNDDRYQENNKHSEEGYYNYNN